MEAWLDHDLPDILRFRQLRGDADDPGLEIDNTIDILQFRDARDLPAVDRRTQTRKRRQRKIGHQASGFEWLTRLPR